MKERNMFTHSEDSKSSTHITFKQNTRTQSNLSDKQNKDRLFKAAEKKQRFKV